MPMSIIRQLRASIPFRTMLLGIFFLEVLSLFGWIFPVYGNIVFLVAAAAALILALNDLRYGIGIMVAELLIGSHGYLLSFQHEGLAISLRIGLFLALMTATVVHAWRDKRLVFFTSRYFWPYAALFLAVVYAAARGYATGNGFGNVFLDANGFLFFGMAFPIWQAIRGPEDWRLLRDFAFAGLIASTVKVFTLLYLFAHAIWWMLPDLYRWVRDTRIAELTQQFEGPFFRIFLQSQLYVVIAMIILACLSLAKSSKVRERFADLNWRWGFVFATALFSSILVSLSRSFWMGMLAAGLGFLAAIALLYKPCLRKMLQPVSDGILSLLISLVFITAVVLFPFPSTSGEFSAGSLFGQRALTFSGEAGVGSRWNLLPALWDEVNDHIFLGKGFGEEVTYVTEDPRLLAINPTGEYTTFVFEWGYLDLWLKFGLLGLLVYAAFVVLVIKQGWMVVWNRRLRETQDSQTLLTLGFLLGGIAMLVTHTFSPYLHHPLGIAFLLFWALQTETRQFIRIDNQEQNS